ncbi:MAG TPA: alpha/beta hydrolase [Gemmatimonadaceae bacterium]|nr:alpha/beta hydrolase [Gemmatimonadaceae bacterium]
MWRAPRLGPQLGTALLAACSGSGGADGRASAQAGSGGESVVPTASCPPDDDRDAAALDTTYDVTYATAGGQPLRLDIARPRGGGPRPLVILLHGGGWSGGSRLSMRAEMLSFARRGYVAASVGYRLTQGPRNVFPAAVADVRCAVRFLRSHARSYGIDPRRIAAAGYSAGGHLASMLGAAAEVGGLDDGCPLGGDARVAAVVSYAGPQDLRVTGPYTAEQERLVTTFLGVFSGDDPRTAAAASPIVHVGHGDPPFLFVHGRDDPLVPVEHARRMTAALRRAGVPATVLELRRTKHAFVGLSASGRATVRCTTAAFLARWLGEPTR